MAIGMPMKGDDWTGLHELISMLEDLDSLQKQKYLAEWILKLLCLCCKIQANRQILLRIDGAINALAGRLFESVGAAGDASNANVVFSMLLEILEALSEEMKA